MKIKKICPIPFDVLKACKFFFEGDTTAPDECKKWKKLNPQKVIDPSYLINPVTAENFIEYYNHLVDDDEKKLQLLYEVNIDEGENIIQLLKEFTGETIDANQIYDEQAYTLFEHEPWHGYQYFLEKMDIPEMWDKDKNGDHDGNLLREPQVTPPSAGNELNQDKPIYPKIAIIDSGINFDNLELHRQYELVPQNGGKYKYPGYNAAERNFRDNKDENGHGTFIAGLLSSIKNSNKGRGVVDEFKVLNIKAFSKGKGGTASICNALFFAVKEDATIINCSWGPRFHNGNDKALKVFLNFAYKHKIICVCAAGNQGNNVENYYPASSKQVITVGASNKHNILMESSNFGKGIDVIAPGESILSLSSNAEAEVKSGTSFAAALISGCIAVVLGLYPIIRKSSKLTPTQYFKEIKKLLQDQNEKQNQNEDQNSPDKIIRSYEELNYNADLLKGKKLLQKAKALADRLNPQNA